MENIPEMLPVISSNVNAVGYDEEKKELHVKFNNGSYYKYLNVGLDVYKSLRAAESVGKYLNTNIKNVYQFVKVG